MGAIHFSEPVWTNGRPTKPTEIRAGDEIESYGSGGYRRVRVTKTLMGSGQGTIWLHGASGAQIRCLRDQRVAVSVRGRRSFRRADRIQPGDFLLGLTDGRLCVDPVVAIREVRENVPAVFLEMPSASLVSEEGLICRAS